MTTTVDSWHVLRESGFVDQAVPKDLQEYTREKYFEYWDTDRPTKIARVTYDGVKPVGLTAATQITGDRWLFHHLAKVLWANKMATSATMIRDLIDHLPPHGPDEYEINFSADAKLSDRLFLNYAVAKGVGELRNYNIYRHIETGMALGAIFTTGRFDLRFGHEGVNIFNLTNVAHVSVGRDFYCAREEFFNRGKKSFLIFVPRYLANNAAPLELSAVFQDTVQFVSAGCQWVFNKAVLNDWYKYLEGLDK